MKQATKEKKMFRFRDHFGRLTESPLHWADFVILGLLMLFCFLSYTMRDLAHTAGCSYGFLDGHFLDFYDYLAASGIDENGLVGLHASYMPTVYLLFAVWNLPMKLFGIVPQASASLGLLPLMWAKVLPCLVFLGSAYIVLLISKELGMENRKAKVVMYAYLSMPIALYGQFILGQYESFVVFCVLLGVYYWLKKKPVWFVFWFAVALTFKITALLFFLPLLLLREKSIFKILLSAVAVFLLYGLEFLLYRGSPTFLSYAFGIGSAGDNPTGYVFNAAVFTGFIFTENLKFEVYLTVVGFAVLCAYAYFKRADGKDEGRYALYLLCLAGAVLFGLSKWHPHWLMIVVPFWTVSAFLHRDSKIWMALDLLFMAVFVSFCTCQFAGVTDEVMLTRGIFKYILPNGVPTVRFEMAEIFGKLDMSLELSVITALLVVYAVFRHPKFMADDANAAPDSAMGWLRARYILGLLIFIVPSMMVVWNSVGDQKASYLENNGGAYVASENADFTVSQAFVAKEDKISKIKFNVSLGANPSAGSLSVAVLLETNEKCWETVLDLNDFTEGELVTVTPGVDTVPGETYTVVFATEGLPAESTFRLYGNTGGAYEHAVLDGEPQEYHLMMNVYR